MAKITIYLSRGHAKTSVYAIPYTFISGIRPSDVALEERDDWIEIGYLEGSYNPTRKELVACVAWHLKDQIENQEGGHYFVVEDDSFLEDLFEPHILLRFQDED